MSSTFKARSRVRWRVPSPARALAEPLPGVTDAFEAFRRVTQPGEPALFLDACPLARGVTPAERALRAWSFIAVDARTAVTVDGSRAWRRERGDAAWHAWDSVADAFTAARRLRAEAPALAAPDDAGLPPFPAGVAGLLAYDAGRALERLPTIARADSLVPDAFLARFDAVIAFDHEGGRAWLAYADTPEGAEDAVRLRARLVRPPRALGNGVTPAPRPTLPRRAFEDMVARARDLVHEGDVFQVNLSHRLDAPTRPDVDPLALYARLREANPAPMSGVLLTGPLPPDGREVNVLSSSPERLFSAHADGTLDARPIAGTRRRGRSAAEDAALAHELATDAKENAEHVMLVDLARNDLGRVAAYGSVRVPRLLAVESYRRVHHLVSTVTARLAPGKDAVDATAALFPGGTITGAPKVRAMEIIEALEPVRRGAYTGGIGYWSGTGAADWNILIRSLVHAVHARPGREGRLSLQVGAGIVWDSDPAREWEETLAKARGILDAFPRRQRADDGDEEGRRPVADRVA